MIILELSLAVWLSINNLTKPFEGFDFFSVLYQNVQIFIMHYPSEENKSPTLNKFCSREETYVSI